MQSCTDTSCICNIWIERDKGKMPVNLEHWTTTVKEFQVEHRMRRSAFSYWSFPTEWMLRYSTNSLLFSCHQTQKTYHKTPSQLASKCPKERGEKGASATPGFMGGPGVSADAVRVTVEPLYGCKLGGSRSGSNAAFSTLLTLDGVKVLLDCGWTPSMDLTMLQPLARVAPEIDVVLISHADLAHCGGLPYAISKLGLKAPVYATLPVQKMGQMHLIDYLRNRQESENFSVYDLEDIQAAVSQIRCVRYSQQISIGKDSSTIVLTGLPAGRLLGSTVWRVVKEGEEVVYAVDVNQRKDRFLGGTALENLRKPALLITDSYSATLKNVSRPKRDKEVLSLIVKTMRADGNVLIPIDAAGRIFDLILLLEQHWTKNHLSTYQLVVFTPVARTTLELAKSQLEWMNSDIMKRFESARDNPFWLKNFKLCQRMKEFESLPAGPKVVLASSPDMESGPARKLFSMWAEDPRNLVLFTDWLSCGSSDKSLAHTLMSSASPTSMEIDISIQERVPLEGTELMEYEEEARKQQQRQFSEVAIKAQEEAVKAEALKKEGKGKCVGLGKTSIGYLVKKKIGFPATIVWQGTNRPGGVFTEGFELDSRFKNPAFPLDSLDEPSSWDAYGEIVDKSSYEINREKYEAVGEGLVGGSNEDDADYNLEEGLMLSGNDMTEDEIDDLPTKLVEIQKKLTVRCKQHIFDYSGRTDSRSTRMLIEHVGPKQIVILGGDEGGIDVLRQHLITNEVTTPNKIHAPQDSQIVDVTSDLAMFRAILSEEVIQGSRFTKHGEYEVAWIDATLESPGDGNEQDACADNDANMEEKDPVDFPSKEQSQNQATHVTLGRNLYPQGHEAVFVGEIRLGKLKQVLEDSGIQAEIGEEKLLCGGQVTIRKSKDGGFYVEGALSEEYFQMRKLLYSQFCVL